MALLATFLNNKNLLEQLQFKFVPLKVVLPHKSVKNVKSVVRNEAALKVLTRLLEIKFNVTLNMR